MRVHFGPRVLTTEPGRDSLGGGFHFSLYAHGIFEHVTDGLASKGEDETSEKPEDLLGLPLSSISTINLLGILGETMISPFVTDLGRAAYINCKASPSDWYL